MGMKGSTPIASTNSLFIINGLQATVNFVNGVLQGAVSPPDFSHGFLLHEYKSIERSDYSWQE